MLARMWGGKTRKIHAEEYLDYLKKTGLKEYASTPGNRGVRVLRRLREDQVEFLLISMWDSLDSIRAFAGPEPDRACYYPEDDRYLLEKTEMVDHFEIVFDSDEG